MGSHIIDGEFQSDKYPTTPRGKVPLSVRDVTAQDLCVIGVSNGCRAFTWEFERELAGSPLANKHLRLFMVEGD